MEKAKGYRGNGLVKDSLLDIATAIGAGSIVAIAYFFFQNSNEFAPGGVGGWQQLPIICSIIK